MADKWGRRRGFAGKSWYHGRLVNAARQVPGKCREMQELFVRIGSLGEVHSARSGRSLRRGQRVLVRTDRGVELAEVLGPRGNRTASPDPEAKPPCQVLRVTTREDELLIQRLLRHKREAVETCQKALAESGSKTLLLDVDQLFDGGTLVMHFLGELDETAETITQQVARNYESIVRTEHFANLLTDGCGPGCGTEESSGCGGQCAGCSARIVCHTR